LLKRGSIELQRSSSPESAISVEVKYGRVLVPRWCNLLLEKPGFSHVASCDDIDDISEIKG
jgi:hypothetical protein